MPTTWTQETITDAGTATSTLTPSTAWTVETVDLNVAASTLSLSSGSLTLSNSLLSVDDTFTIRTTESDALLKVNAGESLLLYGRLAIAGYVNGVIETTTSAGQFRVNNNLVVDDDATIGGDLTITGASEFNDDVSVNDIAVNGSITVTETLDVQGLITAVSNITCPSLISNTITASSNFTLDAVGDIELNADGGDIVFKDNTTTLATISSGSNKFQVGTSFTWDNATFTIDAPETLNFQPHLILANAGGGTLETPLMTFKRTDTTDSDILGLMAFEGTNDEDGVVTYSQLYCGVIEDDATADGERGYLSWQVQSGNENTSQNILYGTGGTDGNVYFKLGTTGDKIETYDNGNCILDFSGNITLDAASDITLDADGADIFLKDGGVTFGSFVPNGGELAIKSSSSVTTAIICSGANVAIAGQFACNGQSVASAPNYTISNLSTDRALDCNSTSEAELADVLGQVITDLIAVGVFQ